jgi:hypothetical protein
LRRYIAEEVLVGVDLDPCALEVTRLALEMAVGEGDLKLQLRCEDALLAELGEASFDAVVGNPPWGQKGLRIDKRLRERYAQRYRTCRGVYDPFKLFVERSHQLLRRGGRWGLVLPDIVLLKDQQTVRDLILELSALDCIVHAGRIFEGVNLDAALLVGTRRAMDQDESRVSIYHSMPERSDHRPAFSRVQREFREFPGHKFNLYLRGAELSLWRKLREFPTLGERFEMHEGVHSGNCRSKLFVKRRHSRRCKPLIVGGKEVARYRLRWGGRFLDTDPRCVDRGRGDYANLGRAEWHEGVKLVVRRTGDRIVAAVDLDGRYVSNNLFVLVPREVATATDLRACAALLNSTLMTWFFRAEQPRTGRLFAELKLVHLREFPRPTAQVWSEVAAELAGFASELEHESDPRARETLSARIDELVERAFELSPAERKLITISQ